MPNIVRPKCLSRRYEALDQLIEELALSTGVSVDDYPGTGVNLMRQFWEILKENPEVNLTEAVEKCTDKCSFSDDEDERSREVADSCAKCYQVQRSNNYTQEIWGDSQVPSEPLGDMDWPSAGPLSLSSLILKTNDPYILNRPSCKVPLHYPGEQSTPERKSCVRKSNDKKLSEKRLNERKSSIIKTSCQSALKPKKSFVYSSDAPICDALGKLRTVDSMTKKCNQKIDDMISTTNTLESRMKELEEKEKNGIMLMQEADRMWSAMENCYKKKLHDTYNRQEYLIKEIERAESLVVTARKSCQEREQEIKKIEKIEKETIAQRQQKNIDIQCMRAEIENIEKNIANYSQGMIDSAAALKEKKLRLAQKTQKHIEEALKLQNDLVAEQRNKKYIEIDGNRNLKETRRNLNNLSNTHFSKKIESKELSYQQESVLKDIELLRDLKDQCKDRCMNRDKYINDEIKLLKKKITEFSNQCIQCHQSSDTDDVRKYCFDCPRCQEERACIIDEGFCRSEPKHDCVCMSVKQRFLDNIFDNMYSVLEINSQSKTSKEVADRILNSLQKSRNGKLDEETRKYVQNFILKTVKRNLNGILVGGAVKTRCEMDPETYNQLMLCLTKVTVNLPETKETAVPILQPCSRWRSAQDCQCAKDKSGTCRCDKLAPPATEPQLPAVSSDKSKTNPNEKVVQSTSKSSDNDADTTKRSSLTTRKKPGKYCNKQRGNQHVHRHEIVSRPESIMSVYNEVQISKSYNSVTKSNELNDFKAEKIESSYDYDWTDLNENNISRVYSKFTYDDKLDKLPDTELYKIDAETEAMSKIGVVQNENDVDLYVKKYVVDNNADKYIEKIQNENAIRRKKNLNIVNKIRAIKEENDNITDSKVVIQLEEDIENIQKKIDKSKNISAVDIIKFSNESVNVQKLTKNLIQIASRKIIGIEDTIVIKIEEENKTVLTKQISITNLDTLIINNKTSVKSILTERGSPVEDCSQTFFSKVIKLEKYFYIPIKISDRFHDVNIGMTSANFFETNSQLLLRKTSSNNYLIILNKEFEKSCKEGMNKILKGNEKYEIRLFRDEMGSLVAHTHFKKPISNNEKAYIFMTKSGQIKMSLNESLTNIITVKSTNNQDNIKIDMNKPSCQSKICIKVSQDKKVTSESDLKKRISQIKIKPIFSQPVIEKEKSQFKIKITFTSPDTEEKNDQNDFKTNFFQPRIKKENSQFGIKTISLQTNIEKDNSQFEKKIISSQPETHKENSQLEMIKTSARPDIVKVNTPLDIKIFSSQPEIENESSHLELEIIFSQPEIERETSAHAITLKRSRENLLLISRDNIDSTKSYTVFSKKSQSHLIKETEPNSTALKENIWKIASSNEAKEMASKGFELIKIRSIELDLDKTLENVISVSDYEKISSYNLDLRDKEQENATKISEYGKICHSKMGLTDENILKICEHKNIRKNKFNEVKISDYVKKIDDKLLHLLDNTKKNLINVSEQNKISNIKKDLINEAKEKGVKITENDKTITNKLSIIEKAKENSIKLSKYDKITNNSTMLSDAKKVYEKIKLKKCLKTIGVATTCDNSCDRSKCICGELKIDSNDYQSYIPMNNTQCQSSAMREAIKCTCRNKVGWKINNAQCYSLKDIAYDKGSLPPIDKSCQFCSLKALKNRTEGVKLVSVVTSKRVTYCDCEDKPLSPASGNIITRSLCKSITLRRALLKSTSDWKKMTAIRDKSNVIHENIIDNKVVQVDSLDNMPLNLPHFLVNVS